MWRKKKESCERSRILENFVDRNYLNEMIKSDAGFCSSDRQEYSYNFLNSCHLCHKPLRVGKEIYMYRGDMGFCSVECRNRQMYLDDMKKIEISTRRILASFHERRRQHGGCCTCETRGVGSGAAHFQFKVDKF